MPAPYVRLGERDGLVAREEQRLPEFLLQLGGQYELTHVMQQAARKAIPGKLLRAPFPPGYAPGKSSHQETMAPNLFQVEFRGTLSFLTGAKRPDRRSESLIVSKPRTLTAWTTLATFMGSPTAAELTTCSSFALMPMSCSMIPIFASEALGIEFRWQLPDRAPARSHGPHFEEANGSVLH